MHQHAAVIRWRLVLVMGFAGVLLIAQSVIGLHCHWKSSDSAIAYNVTRENWQVIEKGMDMTFIHPEPSSNYGDSRVIVIRVDPLLWMLDVATAPRMHQEKRCTAREWAETKGFALATNAGMYHWYNTHDGYLRRCGEVLGDEINHYKSVLAFDPFEADEPYFRLFDLDEDGVTIEALRSRYASLVQNLRLIRRPGENRWSRQPRQWSEAALGEDGLGRMLFIFSRSPFSMYDFNRILLKAEIGLVAAQHLDGGPPAQLYLKAGDLELEWFGSYETGINENDDNQSAWAIPNVLGLRRRVAERMMPDDEGGPDG